jgi:predicted ATP-binding protein involved in virulence
MRTDGEKEQAAQVADLARRAAVVAPDVEPDEA